MAGRQPSCIRDDTPTPTRLLKVFGRNSSFLDDIVTESESESLNTPVVTLTSSTDHPLASISFPSTKSTPEKDSSETTIVPRQTDRLLSPPKQTCNPKIRIERLLPVVGRSPDDDMQSRPPRRTGRKPKPIDLDILIDKPRKKPGRKSKRERESISKVIERNDTPDISSQDPNDVKKQKLDSNREAAQRCRIKKRIWIQELEDKSIILAKKNDQLQVSC